MVVYLKLQLLEAHNHKKKKWECDCYQIPDFSLRWMIRDFQRETLWDVCGQADKVCDECEGTRSFLTPSGRVRVVQNTVRETQTSLFSAFFTLLTSILMRFSRQKIHHTVLCDALTDRLCVCVFDVMFDGGNLASLHFFSSARPAVQI